MGMKKYKRTRSVMRGVSKGGIPKWVVDHLDEIKNDLEHKPRVWVNSKYTLWSVNFACFLLGKEGQYPKSKRPFFEKSAKNIGWGQVVKQPTHKEATLVLTGNMFDDAMASMKRAETKIDEQTAYIKLLEEDNAKLKAENTNLQKRVSTQANNGASLAARIVALEEKAARTDRIGH